MSESTYTTEQYQKNLAADHARQEEIARSVALSQEKQMARRTKLEKEDMPQIENNENEEGGSWRQAIAQARKKLKDKKDEIKNKFEDKVMAPAKAAMSKILKQAWLNIPDTWGLSVLWVNIHLFLKWVFGEKMFCKLGDEWLPPKAEEVSGDAGKMAARSAGLVEVMALMFVDLIIFFIIAGFLSLFVNKSTFDNMTGEDKKKQQQTQDVVGEDSKVQESKSNQVKPEIQK